MFSFYCRLAFGKNSVKCCGTPQLTTGRWRVPNAAPRTNRRPGAVLCWLHFQCDTQAPFKCFRIDLPFPKLFRQIWETSGQILTGLFFLSYSSHVPQEQQNRTRTIFMILLWFSKLQISSFTLMCCISLLHVWRHVPVLLLNLMARSSGALVAHIWRQTGCSKVDRSGSFVTFWYKAHSPWNMGAVACCWEPVQFVNTAISF